MEKARRLAREWAVPVPERMAPIQVIGSGADLNAAAQNGLERKAALLEESLDEVKNRVTITGASPLFSSCSRGARILMVTSPGRRYSHPSHTWASSLP